MEQSPPRSVCLMGHSYIRRLREFMDRYEDYKNLDLAQNDFIVNERARGDLTVNRLAQASDLWQFDTPPNICVLQIGGNDLGRKTSQAVVKDIVNFARFLRDGVGIEIVVVSQLLRRLPWATPPSYSDMVLETNLSLRSEISKEERVYFWRHRGFWSDLTYLGPDGVYLTSPRHDPKPMRKYWWSMRNAVLYAANH